MIIGHMKIVTSGKISDSLKIEYDNRVDEPHFVWIILYDFPDSYEWLW